jgi:RNA polymerase sigma-70 factor, ECF subfamily
MGTDALLVRRAIDGDERALRSLWSQYAPRVDAVVRRLVGDPDYAADVAQEVWIQIFRALPGFRGDSQFGTWAHRIAVNRTLNALRRTKRMQALETGIEESTASTPPEDERPFLRASIDAATARLAPGARAVFVLHDVEGYTHEEIAKTLGITAGGSKSQLFKARAKLRRLLAHLVEPDGTRDDAAPVAPRSTGSTTIGPQRTDSADGQFHPFFSKAARGGTLTHGR